MQRAVPGVPPSRRPLPQGPSRNLLLNGKSYPTKVRLIRGGSLPPVKRRRMNWIDAPDDVFYMATDETRWGPPRGRGRAGGRPPQPRHPWAPLCPQEDPQAAIVLGDQARCPQALQAHRPAPEPSPAAAAAPAGPRQRRAHRHRGLGAPLPREATPTTARIPARRPPARRPVLVVPPSPHCREAAPSGHLGKKYFNLFPEGRGVVFSFVFTFWPERS